MAIQMHEAVRKFSYQGVDLGDPDSAMSPEEVRDFYAGHYGELTTAEINDLGIQNGAHHFEFVKQVGKKG